MPDSALAVSTEGKQKSLHSEAASLLPSLLETLDAKEEYIDDAKWDKLPEVGAGLKEVATTEECFCVAMCASIGIWAVGVGMKGQHRLSAARLALTASLAIFAEESGHDVDLSAHQAVAGFIDATKLAAASGGDE